MKVAILMGGPSPEHDVSILSGLAVWRSLAAAGRDVVGVAITRESRFVLLDRLPAEGALPVEGPGLHPLEAMIALRERGVESFFLALHGAGGEDGSIQGFLDWAGMPYTGAGCAASVVAMDKVHFKALLVDAGLPTARHASASRECYLKSPEAVLDELMAHGLVPGFIKAPAAGSSFGVHLVRDENEAREALAIAFKDNDRLLFEARVVGPELTVPLIGHADGTIEALPVVEIRPRKGEFFDLASKYDEGGADEICPAPIDPALAEQVTQLAIRVHRMIGARGMTRTDFMVGEDGPMILETNTIPGLTAPSIYPKAIRAAGWEPADFYWMMVTEALERPLFGGR